MEIDLKKFGEGLDEFLKAEARPSFIEDANVSSLQKGETAFELICSSLEKDVLGLNVDPNKKMLYDKLIELADDNYDKRKQLFTFCGDLWDDANEISDSDEIVFEKRTSDGVGNEEKCKAKRRNIDEDALDEFLKLNEKPRAFADVIDEFMDLKNMNRPDVYKAADISRQDFSRIYSIKCKNMSKRLIFNLIIGLELDYPQAKRLLHAAGYTFNKTKKFDNIIRYCVLNGFYDKKEIDILLWDRTGSTLISSFEPSVTDLL